MKGLFLEEIFCYMYKKDALRGEERREYTEKLESYLINALSNNLKYGIKEIIFKRDSFNFTAKDHDGESIFFNFSRYDNTCNINFNHKYEISLKMNKSLIDKSLSK